MKDNFTFSLYCGISIRGIVVWNIYIQRPHCNQCQQLLGFAFVRSSLDGLGSSHIYEPNLSFFPRNEWRNICLKTYQNISFAYNIVLTGKCLIAVDKITTLTTLEKFEDEIDKIKTLEIKMIIIPNLKRVQFEL